MKKTFALTGCEAAAEAMKQIDPDVIPVYPITPSAEIMEVYSRFVADGLVSGELMLVESEHSAMSAAIGASAAGARVMTATDAQGLVYLYEMLYVASGMRLPIVISVANRALSAPGNIHPDHSDSMSARDSSWIQIYSETAQDVYENTLLAVRLAEHPKVFLPVMICQDGFLTSGNVVRTQIFGDREVKRFVGEYKPKRITLLDIDKPAMFGGLKMQASYYETKMQQIDAMREAKKVYLEISKELSKISGRDLGYFEDYRLKDAEVAIVTMAATAGTVKRMVDIFRDKGKKVGLLNIRLFRPFPYKEVAAKLKGMRAVGVLDRSDGFGAFAPLYLDVLKSLEGLKSKAQAYVFGLGGRYIFAKDIENVFNELLQGKVSKETKYIGVK